MSSLLVPSLREENAVTAPLTRWLSAPGPSISPCTKGTVPVSPPPNHWRNTGAKKLHYIKNTEAQDSFPVMLSGRPNPDNSQAHHLTATLSLHTRMLEPMVMDGAVGCHPQSKHSDRGLLGELESVTTHRDRGRWELSAAGCLAGLGLGNPWRPTTSVLQKPHQSNQARH